MGLKRGSTSLKENGRASTSLTNLQDCILTRQPPLMRNTLNVFTPIFRDILFTNNMNMRNLSSNFSSTHIKIPFEGVKLQTSGFSKIV